MIASMVNPIVGALYGLRHSSPLSILSMWVGHLMSACCDLFLVSLELRILAASDVNAHVVAKFVYCYDGCNAGPGLSLMEQ